MRRPPALLIVVAVMLTGVSVGWAASHDTDSPSVVAMAAVPPESVEPVVTLQLSTAAEDSSDPAEPGIERVVQEPAEDLVPVVTDTSPSHLEEKVVSIVVEPLAVVPTTSIPPAPPVTAAQPSVVFTAGQAYGWCEEQIPYDIFSGTAEPGSTVTISSAYGSGTSTADGSGHWERKVEFAGAPRGETFTVTAAGVGGTKTFDFTAV